LEWRRGRSRRGMPIINQRSQLDDSRIILCNISKGENVISVSWKDWEHVDVPLYIPGSLSVVKSQFWSQSLNGIRAQPISKQCLHDNMIGYTKIWLRKYSE
jgi:hypothetical protein